MQISGLGFAGRVESGRFLPDKNVNQRILTLSYNRESLVEFHEELERRLNMTYVMLLIVRPPEPLSKGEN